MIRSSLAACLIVVPMIGAAQNACPGPADRNKPIRIVFEDDTVEVYRRQAGPVTLIEGFDGGTLTYTIEVVHGTHMLSYETIVDGVPDRSSRIDYDYGLGPSGMPVPSPGGRWQVDAVFSDIDGSHPEAQSQAYGPLQTIQIGACTYDAFDVYIAYDSPDGYMETLVYLPALELGYLYSTQTDNDPAFPVAAVGIELGK